MAKYLTNEIKWPRMIEIIDASITLGHITEEQKERFLTAAREGRNADLRIDGQSYQVGPGAMRIAAVCDDWEYIR